MKTQANHSIPQIISSTGNTGSEQLRTDASFNPWDVPSGPDKIPPSERVAGRGEEENTAEPGGKVKE